MIRHIGRMTRENRQAASTRRPARKGTIIVLTAFFLVVLLAMTMFTVDVAYMQLVRTELRTATDAAAKAATETLARTQSTTQARAAAVQYAAANTVAGRSLVLAPGDIDIGSITAQSDGTWKYTSGGTPQQAVRVNGRMLSSNSNGAVKLFFGGIFGSSSFSPQFSATAAQTQVQICLALDRSHSMCFDMSGVMWSYPPETPQNPDPICYKPGVTNSRWAALSTAITSFVNAASACQVKPQVAMVTWASDIDNSTYEYSMTHQTSPATFNDVGVFTTTYPLITTAIALRSSNVMLGGTNMSSGMDAATSLLTGSGSNPMANKIMILMTDGQWNAGRDPTLAAADAAAAGVTIHVVTLLPLANQPDMDDVASIGGGKHYHANDSAALSAAFVDIVRTLPIVLTQ